jgi:hypothetical protein
VAMFHIIGTSIVYNLLPDTLNRKLELVLYDAVNRNKVSIN